MKKCLREKKKKKGKEVKREEGKKGGRNEEREINRGTLELRDHVGGCLRFIILLILKKTEGKLTKINRATSSWVSVGWELQLSGRYGYPKRPELGVRLLELELQTAVSPLGKCFNFWDLCYNFIGKISSQEIHIRVAGELPIRAIQCGNKATLNQGSMWQHHLASTSSGGIADQEHTPPAAAALQGWPWHSHSAACGSGRCKKRLSPKQVSRQLSWPVLAVQGERPAWWEVRTWASGGVANPSGVLRSGAGSSWRLQ